MPFISTLQRQPDFLTKQLLKPQDLKASPAHSKDTFVLTSQPMSLDDLLKTHSFQSLIKNSGNKPYASFEEFTKARKFIAEAIPKSGSILDIGCGNGLFLRCLQDWTPPHIQLVPYGSDIEQKFIAETGKLFPNFSKNFAVQTVGQYLKEGPPKNLPKTYDYIFTCLQMLRQNPENIQQLLSRINPGGRLILGFYGQNPERVNGFRKQINDLEKAGIEFTAILENQHGDSNMVAYIQK